MTTTNNDVHFDGDDYIPEFDLSRLTGQILRVYEVIKDGKWRTLYNISFHSHAPESSVSAQLRNLRKERFGSHTIIKRRKANKGIGLYEYRLVIEDTIINPKTDKSND